MQDWTLDFFYGLYLTINILNNKNRLIYCKCMNLEYFAISFVSSWMWQFEIYLQFVLSKIIFFFMYLISYLHYSLSLRRTQLMTSWLLFLGSCLSIRNNALVTLFSNVSLLFLFFGPPFQWERNQCTMFSFCTLTSLAEFLHWLMVRTPLMLMLVYLSYHKLSTFHLLCLWKQFYITSGACHILCLKKMIFNSKWRQETNQLFFLLNNAVCLVMNWCLLYSFMTLLCKFYQGFAHVSMWYIELAFILFTLDLPNSCYFT